MPLRGSDAAVDQGQFHVVKRRSSSEQIEGLKNKPYFLIAYTRQLVVVHFRNILIVKPVLALARRIETADQIHQRRLARARRPDDRNVLTPWNIKGDTMKRMHLFGGHLVGFADPAHRDQCIGVVGLNRLRLSRQNSQLWW